MDSNARSARHAHSSAGVGKSRAGSVDGVLASVESAARVSRFLIADTRGTIFSSAVADRFGPTRLWVVITGIETVIIGFLPWFMSADSSGLWGRYAAVASCSLFNMVTMGPLTNNGAISHEFFGLGLAIEALGFLHLAFGVAGLVGPVIMENMYQVSHTFESFLYLSGGFFVSGLISLALLHSCYRSPDKIAAERETEIS